MIYDLGVINKCMTQERVWDKEYRQSKFLTKENKPQADVVRFVKWLKKRKIATWKLSFQVLDLGSGTGRNSFYFAGLGAKVIGYEISQTAINIAKNNMLSGSIYDISYIKQSIGEKFDLEDESMDIVLDVTSSNSLNEKQREIFLTEVKRVLKNGGYFFTKALCKDGDSNSKSLLAKFPGKEKDTYVMPDTGIIERVWSREDFVATYDKYFQILSLEKKTSYTRMNNRSYKRNFWICYLCKK